MRLSKKCTSPISKKYREILGSKESSMAKRNDSILDDLALYPWWVNVILAVIVYLSMRYWIPTIQFQNTFYAGMAKIAPVLAPFIAGMILVAAAVSAFDSGRKGQLLKKQKGIGNYLNSIIYGAKASDNICPLCGGEMVLRTARKGPKAGEKFWGCSAFPKCRGKKPHYV